MNRTPIARLLVILGFTLIVACGGDADPNRASPVPESTLTASQFASGGAPIDVEVCRSGSWTRPSDAEQRAFLESLGGEVETPDGMRDVLFAGSVVSEDGSAGVWKYRVLWPLLTNPDEFAYATAMSGLWSSAPDAAECMRPNSSLTLVLDHRMIGMRLDGDTIWITADPSPGTFQLLRYSNPERDTRLFYLIDGAGALIDGCCT